MDITSKKIHHRREKGMLPSLPILAFQVRTDKFQVSLRCFSLDAVQISPRFPSRGLLDGPRVEDVDPVRKAGCEHQLTVRMPAVKLEKAEGKKRAR